MKYKRVVLAVFYSILTVSIILALVLMAYRMIGAAGCVGAAIVIFAIIANGFISKIDDDEFYKK